MAGIRRQPFCACGAPVTPPRTRYCSDGCARAAARRRHRLADAARPKRDRAAYARERYQIVKADPELHARRLEAQRRYAATHRERARESQRQWKERLRADAERFEAYLEAERQRKRTVDPERKRAQQRASYWRLRANPKRWAHFLETHRLAYRLRCEQAGRPVAPVPAEKYPQASRHWRMPVAPIIAAIDARLVNGELSGHNLAEACGVPQRTIRRLRNEQQMVSVSVADRILIGLGLHLDLLETP